MAYVTGEGYSPTCDYYYYEHVYVLTAGVAEDQNDMQHAQFDQFHY